MPKIALKYVEDDSERTLELTEGEIAPLGFDDLANIFEKLHLPISFPLRLTKIKLGRNELDELNGEKVNSVSASLDSTLGSTTIGLVKGGWLPSGLAISDSVILPDRCTVAAIRSRFLGGTRKSGVHDDFLDFLADHPVRINPMLCAMEGISGSTSPNEAELSAIFDRTANGILMALPHAVIFPEKTAVMKGALGLLQDSAGSFQLKQKFLLKAAPLLSAPAGKAKRLDLLDQMFELAYACGISKASILMLTVLSAASAGQSMNPARKLLKPRNPYTKKDAYNALSDLRALDLLIGACADFPNLQVSLMTNDKALALLWSGLQAHSFRRNGLKIEYSINPHRALFNVLSDKEVEHMWDRMTRESA